MSKKRTAESAALSAAISTLEALIDGRCETRVPEDILNAADKESAKLGAAVNRLGEAVVEMQGRAEEYHESTMSIAIGMSECFQVLAEVQKGNLSTRVGKAELESDEELMAALGQTLNDTVTKLQNQVQTIQRQQFAIQELSTPVLQLWDNVLALPIIGVVDTARSIEIMERLLSEISARQSRYVILDITGVEIVDTKTADHFIKIIKAPELLGTRCIFTGIRPAVAQTLVEIGVGNVELRAVSRESIHPVSVPGIVGRRIRKLRPMSYTIATGDLFVLFSDGISSRFSLQELSHLPCQALVEQLLEKHGKHHDDASCVAVRW